MGQVAIGHLLIFPDLYFLNGYKSHYASTEAIFQYLKDCHNIDNIL